MNSNVLRQSFYDFFEVKKHTIVSSAPMVVKNDPTLMFTNAGMNQFKDIFLGNSAAKYLRVANSQKCLRVSGKHNDLEEVGHDTYHHTMFEMLGNWSFGDYFKQEAIDWAWEYLTEKLKITKENLYVTVFEGSKDDGVDLDSEALSFWRKHLPESQILYGNKKDNFWEMGDQGPCGPCSEVHIDIRDEEEKSKIKGAELVNKDHPQVIEIWNLVFVQYNRKSNGELESLPNKHVDTGMGFERLAMVMQGVQSNYDTDIFTPYIKEISKVSKVEYGNNEKSDIAMRVISDHLRTIAFAIADGQLPSNNKAGYVIRRILRRAVRYGYTFLKLTDPFIFKLIPVLIENMGKAYPELVSQKEIIMKVILEEETTFLRTLSTGIKMLEEIISKVKKEKQTSISGKVAFELYDTYGFPLDLTELILKEQGLTLNKAEFDNEMEQQKNRSRNASVTETDDWVIIREDDVEEFVGYDYVETQLEITKYRKVKDKKNEYYQLVFSITPFYAESGGQVGDKGYIEANGEKVTIFDTKKENNLIIHFAKKLPSELNAKFKAVVNNAARISTEANHSATHLLHAALREVLGDHVEQKGSLVQNDRLRFDFAHFQKVSDEELNQVESIVNEKIRANVPLTEHRDIPISEAEKMGAMALFGEKYGDVVRVIKFGDSIELCGGTHVSSTGKIGLCIVTSESAIAAGIRRIEAITGIEAYKHLKCEVAQLNSIRELVKNPKNPIKAINDIIDNNLNLKACNEAFAKEKAQAIKLFLKNNITEINGVKVIKDIIEIDSASSIKDICFQLKGEEENLFVVLGAILNGKANVTVMVSDKLVKEKGLHAGNIIKDIAKEIGGGGGGQPFFATAGGKNPDGIQTALDKALGYLK
ncbi:alanine--tRNA ligase [Bacteroidales bacterium]|nr:alanine--tRNA ligase [Bacteroidales bacterium]